MHYFDEEDMERFMRASNAIEGEFDKIFFDLPSPNNATVAKIRVGALHPNDVDAAMRFVHNPFTAESLSELHVKLFEGHAAAGHELDIRHPGDYRHTGEDLSSPRGCALGSMVKHLMGNYILDFDKFSPWESHWKFEKIHPFEDLNGRTGRLIWLHKMLNDDNQADYFVSIGFLQTFYYQTLSNLKK